MAESIRTATLQDRDRITALINRAFAVERFFKSGDRIDATQVVQMLSEGTFLLAVDEEGLAACVYVKPNGERAYIGLLSVDPAKQKSGLGRRMMQAAEDFSRAAGCKGVDIRVVNLREELLPIYTKMGFVQSGVESADSVKNATQPIHFIRMSKPL